MWTNCTVVTVLSETYSTSGRCGKVRRRCRQRIWATGSLWRCRDRRCPGPCTLRCHHTSPEDHRSSFLQCHTRGSLRTSLSYCVSSCFALWQYICYIHILTYFLLLCYEYMLYFLLSPILWELYNKQNIPTLTLAFSKRAETVNSSSSGVKPVEQREFVCTFQICAGCIFDVYCLRNIGTSYQSTPRSFQNPGIRRGGRKLHRFKTF